MSLIARAVIVACVILPGVLAGGAGAQQPVRPNIIYVMADDLGYGDLGCYGQRTIATPNIDRMAAEGMMFTDYYAAHTVCRPSRLSLRTGMHIGRLPIQSNESATLPPDARITTKLLKRAGYAVGGIGKWALGEPGSTGMPHKQGLDMWFGYLHQRAAHLYWPEWLWLNDTKFPLRNKVTFDRESGNAYEKVDYSHDAMWQEAMSFIARQAAAERPFFLQMHITIPHANNEGQPHGMEVPNFMQYADEDWPEPEKGFAAMVSWLDRDMGRLLAWLKRLDIDRSTIVFFTSDNGPHREGGHEVDFFDSNGPLRGHKRDLYEGGIRVPMIVRWPGQVEPGTLSDLPCAGWDFMPTACDLAGVDSPDDIDGLSMVPTLLGEPGRQQKHEHLYWAYKDKRALRAGEWKVVRPGKDKPTELYNLEEDPGEQNNLAGEHPQRLRQLEAIMEAELDPGPIPTMD